MFPTNTRLYKLRKKALVGLPLFLGALFLTLLSPATFALLLMYIGRQCWRELTQLKSLPGPQRLIHREKAYVVAGFCSAALLRAISLPMTLAVGLGAIANDVFANISGMLLGKKLIRRGLSHHSPNKSWEGAIIGVAAGTWFFSRFTRSLMPMPLRVILGLIVNCAGVAGDLQESQMKRSYGVKDVGGALGEHGGWTDRVDNLLRSFVVGTFLFALLRLRKRTR